MDFSNWVGGNLYRGGGAAVEGEGELTSHIIWQYIGVLQVNKTKYQMQGDKCKAYVYRTR